MVEEAEVFHPVLHRHVPGWLGSKSCLLLRRSMVRDAWVPFEGFDLFRQLPEKLCNVSSLGLS